MEGKTTRLRIAIIGCGSLGTTALSTAKELAAKNNVDIDFSLVDKVTEETTTENDAVIHSRDILVSELPKSLTYKVHNHILPETKYFEPRGSKYHK
ncbi:hypothetical protein Molly5_179 [Maribacter phage Molly_5]|uniref:Uncharacterized protein n=1 Tax=Maribacter phage Molly_1 TaxID=2745685 RepID=A0A8E4UYC1_9CAUD|nr:hypothetical protein M1M29_gp179 [Maribacter phage Molly_1]QQO97676.1 hypothetical protein Molly2_179 [Maribacter phage Molly_2]QQO97876.1 hypothetical protein Molly3_179 [Maribacter phage Molly_3]QQO98076.1 hypothetical protein Molly4_179 [Maribacter phage Molly_4]QQO98276.1 hypothetical protein Molly5_179 [Maribacter phage Molly_5]QQO97476.1 hypothetical protein Molly1_179 [Maribacter phage Molly_1]